MNIIHTPSSKCYYAFAPRSIKTKQLISVQGIVYLNILNTYTGGNVTVQIGLVYYTDYVNESIGFVYSCYRLITTIEAESCVVSMKLFDESRHLEWQGKFILNYCQTLSTQI